MPNLYIISGCNGAGKTLASYAMFPEMLDCKEFINADEIAKGLSPFQPERASIEAGRLMVYRMNEMLQLKEDFAIETTLATKSYASFIRKAQSEGYFVTLIYFWLDSPELAIRRVEQRVSMGGHNVPEDVIRRRYRAGMRNLFRMYVPISDYWILIDNSTDPFQMIAEGNRNEIQAIHHVEIFNYLQSI
ncbi:MULTISPECIES: zeta toxin family protein [unclassified Dysgonomonas]|uniref:zeta toxin family protein n=1 Tax=unclassified Dysgonomonas TaxID=2630389 RepID=UPI0013E9CF13|nr:MULTISPECIES: zeta toxin family protein [unclassified Dysgonomonas]